MAVFYNILNNYLYSVYETKTMGNLSIISNSFIGRWCVHWLSYIHNCKRMKQQQTSDLLLGVFFLATLILIVTNV